MASPPPLLPQPQHRVGDAVIVGAGPAGCLTAIYCIRRGFHVHLFDKRKPPADGYVGSDSRSYTMLLTCRALEALQGAQVQVPTSLMGPLVGSCVHLPNKKTRVFKYLDGDNNTSYGVSRNGLVRYLQRVLLQRYPRHVSPHFEYELAEVDDDKCVAVFQSTRQDGGSIQVEYGLLVGADGVSSKTRSEMLRLEETRPETPSLTFKYTRNPESYKSFYVAPGLAKSSPLFAHHNYVQSWPALNMLLVGMADGSFWGGSKNSELLNATSAAVVEHIFREKAPEVYDLLCQQNSNFSEDFVAQPRISFGGALLLSRFHRRNIVLVGDAAHAMFPSYGTGCNAALEDCLLLDRIMDELASSNAQGAIDASKLAAEFSRRRVEDAHAIVEMSADLRLLPRGAVGILQTTLLRLLPGLFGPTSYQLLWSHVPFKRIKQQKRLEDAAFGVGLVAPVAALAFFVFKALISSD